jgi:hypothetical protein
MQQLTDISKWEFYHYMVAGGLALAVLALLFYLIPALRVKLPAIIVSSLGCLIAGVGIGMLTMVGMGYKIEPPGSRSVDEPAVTGDMAKGSGMRGGAGGMRGGMGGMGGMMMKGGQGGGKGGARGPDPKAQLAGLVDKLDILTARPLAIQLTDDQRAKVAAQLKGLAEPAELSNDDAKKRLDALTEQLKPYKDTLEAAGYGWPGEAGGGQRQTASPANPFKDDNNGKHLKDLQERLTGGKGK